MKNIERIVEDNIVYAIVINSNYFPEKTEFVTSNEDLQQLGFIVYEAGSQIRPHTHKPIKRIINRTTETLIVKTGKVEYQIYNNKEVLIAKGILNNGDIISLLDGGHGFNIIDDAIMIEVKQGPYTDTSKDKKGLKQYE